MDWAYRTYGVIPWGLIQSWSHRPVFYIGPAGDPERREMTRSNNCLQTILTLLLICWAIILRLLRNFTVTSKTSRCSWVSAFQLTLGWYESLQFYPIFHYVAAAELPLQFACTVPEYMFVDWSHCSPERSCDNPTCTIFSLLLFGFKADTVFLYKLHFALHVFIVFSNT